LTEKQNKDLIFCSCSRKVWVGSAVVIGLIIVMALWAFDQLPKLPQLTYYEWNEVYFWLWYALGGGIVVMVTSTIGVYCMMHFCKMMKKEKADDSWFVSLVCFLVLGAVLVAIVANVGDAWDEIQRDRMAVEKRQEFEKRYEQKYEGSGGDNSYQYRDDYYEKNCGYTSTCTIEQYVMYDLTQSTKAYPKQTPAFDAIDVWLENEDCDSLIKWRMKSYQQIARHYAGQKIAELDCLQKGIDAN